MNFGDGDAQMVEFSPALPNHGAFFFERLVASVGVRGAFGIGALKARSAAPTPEAAASRQSKLNVARITEWMRSEGHTNQDLADILKMTVRTVSSLRNNAELHGSDAVARLANEVKCDPEDLYLP
jgi:DNA-binding CsgD family transcriptional regulator